MKAGRGGGRVSLEEGGERVAALSMTAGTATGVDAGGMATAAGAGAGTVAGGTIGTAVGA